MKSKNCIICFSDGKVMMAFVAFQLFSWFSLEVVAT